MKLGGVGARFNEEDDAVKDEIRVPKLRTLGWGAAAVAATAATTANAEFVQINLTGNQITAAGGNQLVADLDGDGTNDVALTAILARSNSLISAGPSSYYLQNIAQVKIDGSLCAAGTAGSDTSPGVVFTYNSSYGPGAGPSGLMKISLSGQSSTNVWLEVERRFDPSNLGGTVGDPETGVYLSRVIYDDDNSVSGAPDLGTTYPAAGVKFSVDTSAPTVDGADIAQLTSTDTDSGTTTIASDHPARGQTFTTGSNADGYMLRSITYRAGASQTADVRYTIRLGSISGTNFTELAAAGTGLVDTDVSSGDYVTWEFPAPVALLPNTVYGVDIAISSGSGYTTYRNSSDATYTGGSAYSSGSSGVGSNTLASDSCDRLFHLNIDYYTPVYEGFDYSAGAELTGNGGTGFDAAWARSRSSGTSGYFGVDSFGLTFSGLDVVGKSTLRTNATGRAEANRVLSAASRAALFADSSTMWFSVLHKMTANEHSGFVIGTGTFDISTGWTYQTYTNAGAEGFGFGCTNTTSIVAIGIDDVSGVSEDLTSVDASSTRLIAGKIIWQSNGNSDRMFLYSVTNVNTEPVKPLAVITNDCDQSQFDQIALLNNKDTATYDEIRLGPTFASVMSGDSDPPTPNPAAFASPPTNDSSTAVSMTATTGSDDSGSVGYYFACTAGGGNDSGWQANPSYTDTGLTPSTTYSYTVRMRDNLGNTGTVSSVSQATTDAAPDTDPPTPSPATFASAPVPLSSTSIGMTATTGSDASGPVEYYFTETSGNPGGTDSGWQTSSSYTDAGLTNSTVYSYTVTMRDSLSNTGTVSSVSQATTTGPEGTQSIAAVYCHNEKDNFGGNPTDMITGSGMNGNPDNYSGSWPTNLPALWTPTAGGFGAEWQSQDLLDNELPVNGKIGWAIFDLGSNFTNLNSFYIWNERESSTRYTKTFNVYVASSPTVAPTHGPTDATSIDYDFASGGWTLINTGGALSGTYQGSQVVGLVGNTGRYVAVEILSNNGDGDRVGLAEVGFTVTISPDTDPPTPSPATFATAPAALSSTAISMTATVGTDASGPVEYYFTETSGHSGGADSGWQTGVSYTNSGLSPSTLYSYTVTMRDSLGNTGTVSTAANATTSAETDPPTPDPATFASAPAALSSTAISMTATAGTDASGPVEYYFTETSGNSGGADSGWQTGVSYTNSGLSPSTLYSYTVTMRDSLGNTGTASSVLQATTQSAATQRGTIFSFR